jgi:hypothetical protein
MECSVLFTDEFECWWDSLTIQEQESVTYSVDLLARLGIELKFPHFSGITGSRYAHMRELRIQHQGRPYRVLYARPLAECRAADRRRQVRKRTVV